MTQTNKYTITIMRWNNAPTTYNNVSDYTTAFSFLRFVDENGTEHIFSSAVPFEITSTQKTQTAQTA
jgi:hypothetical protein